MKAQDNEVFWRSILLFGLFVAALWLSYGFFDSELIQQPKPTEEKTSATDTMVGSVLLNLSDQELEEMSEQEILQLIRKENQAIKKQALRGTELEEFLRASKWKLKTKMVTNLAQETKHESMRHSFLPDGFEFGPDEILLLGKYKVERTWHVIDKTSELFMDSGDDNAFELFDVSGFVYRTEDGFTLKKEVKMDDDEEFIEDSVKWIEYRFQRISG